MIDEMELLHCSNPRELDYSPQGLFSSRRKERREEEREKNIALDLPHLHQGRGEGL